MRSVQTRFSLSVCWIILLLTTAAHGEDRYWTGGYNDWWDYAANWSPSQLPEAGDVLYLFWQGPDKADEIVYYRNTTNPLDLLAALHLDGTSVWTLTLQDAWATNLNTQYLYIGEDGNAAVQIDGGEWTAEKQTYLGVNDNPLSGTAGDGRLYIDSGRFTNHESVHCGYEGLGTMVVRGGTVEVGDDLTLGESFTGDGLIQMYGGTFYSGDEITDTVYVGLAGKGVFRQYDGTHTIAGELRIADDASAADCLYDIGDDGGSSDGTPRLEASAVVVGGAGQGRFTQAGADVEIDNSLVIGEVNGADGLYNFRRGSLVVHGKTYVGAAGNGEMYIGSPMLPDTSATAVFAGPVFVGGQSGSGLLTVDRDSNVTVEGQLIVDGSETAEFHLDGGVVESICTSKTPLIIGDTDAAILEQTGGELRMSGDLSIADASGSYGQYSISETSDAAALTGGHVYVGRGGHGLMVQDDGAVTLSGNLEVACLVGAVGNYLQNGGSLQVGGEARIGIEGEGAFGVGGQTTVAGNVRLGDQPGAAGTLTLHGGSLTLDGSVLGGAGTSLLKHNGGQLNVGGGLISVDRIEVDGDATIWTFSEMIAADSLDVGMTAGPSLIQTGGALDIAGRGIITNGRYALEGGQAEFGTDLTMVGADLDVTDGTLSVLDRLDIEARAAGEVRCNQTGGAVSAGSLHFGATGGGLVSYAMTGQGAGSLNQPSMSCGSATVGGGLVYVQQTGGDWLVAGDAVLSGSPYTAWTINSGLLDVNGSLEMTGDGEVQLKQYGGSIDVAEDLLMADTTGSSASFDRASGQAGSLSCRNLTVGVAGTGEFFLWTDDGSTDIRGNLTLGALAGASGEAIIRGASFLVSQDVIVGDAGRGTMTVESDAAVDGDVLLAAQGASDGRLELGWGELSVAGNIVSGDGRSTVVFDGGTVSAGGGTVRADVIAWGSDPLEGAEFTVPYGHDLHATTMQVGLSGDALVTQDTGSLDVDEDLVIGVSSAAAGSLALRGGTTSIGRDLVVGQAGEALLTLDRSLTVTGSVHVGGDRDSRVEHESGLHAIGGDLVVGGGATAGAEHQYVLHGGELNVAGAVTIAGAGAELNLLGDGVARLDEVNIADGGRLILAGGTLQLPDADCVDVDGGSINYYVGTVAFDGDVVVAPGLSDVCKFFGDSPAITAGRQLEVSGQVVLGVETTLAGGTLSVGTLTNASLLDFRSGTLNMTGDGLYVGSTGPFGSTVIASADRRWATEQMLMVQPEGLMIIDGGEVEAMSAYNMGEIRLSGETAKLIGSDLNNSGVLLGSGRITASLTNDMTGQVRVGEGERLVLLGMGNTNMGHVECFGGEIEFIQGLYNNLGEGASIAARDAILRFGTGLTNDGSAAFAGATDDVMGQVTNSETGYISLGDGTTATFWDNITNNGTINTPDSASAVFLGRLDGTGTFSGGGTLVIEGTLSPGNSPGSMSCDGNVVLQDGMLLEMELAGPTAGQQYDQLTIAGQADLGGTLKLLLLDDYLPPVGESFLLLQARQVHGEFDGLVLPDLPGAMGWELARTEQTLSVNVVPEPCMLGLLAFGGLAALRRRRR